MISVMLSEGYGQVSRGSRYGVTVPGDDDPPVPPPGKSAGLRGGLESERGAHKAAAREYLRGVASFACDLTNEEQAKSRSACYLGGSIAAGTNWAIFESSGEHL